MKNKFLRLKHERKSTLDRKRDYCSFLLRLRQVQTDDLNTWVIAVQNTQTGRQQIYSNLDGLIQFLQLEFGSSPGREEIGPSAATGAKELSA
jgi:hypothetical protein